MKTGRARERLWQAMRKLGSFTSDDLIKSTGAKGNTIQKFLANLADAGVVKRKENVKAGPHKLLIQWKLVKDLGPKAPSIKSSGKISVSKNAREKAWQSMRISRRFTLPDISATAEIGANNLAKYVTPLLKGGYLKLLKKPTGQKGGCGIYHLIRNTGPHAPRLIKGKKIWDLNLKEEIYYGD